VRGDAEGESECEKTKRHAVWDSNKQAIADARLGQRERPFVRRRLEEAFDEAADKFERAPVDDVCGPVLKVIGSACLGGWGSEAEGWNGDLVGTEEKKCAEASSGAGGHFGDELG
jgi:hypothetical protein